jgi:hypothetical protein
LLIIGPLNIILNTDGKNSDEFSTLDKSIFPGNKSNITLGKEMISEEQSCLDHDHVIGESYPNFHDQAPIDDQSPTDDYRSPIFAGSDPRNNLSSSAQPKTINAITGSKTTGSRKMSINEKTIPEASKLVKKPINDERKNIIPEIIVTRVNPVIPLPLSTSANAPPEANNLTITPVNPRTSDDLTANYDYHDVDGDNETGSTICWYKNGELQGNLKDVVTVGAGNTTKGESWKFTLQVFDGEEWSIIYNSSSISILNTAPEVSNVDLTSNPFTTDDLVATWDYIDNDNDSQSYWLILWYKDGVLQAVLNDLTNIPFSLTSKGEEWNYTLQVFDGSDYSIAYDSPTITILNSLPTAYSLTITSNPYNNTDIIVGWIFTDNDTVDSQNSYEIRWYKDGSPQPLLNDKITVEAGNTTKGEVWNYTLRVHDGEAYSIYYNSTTVTILNTLPAATGLNIENAGNLRTTDNLVANWTFSDLDMDSQANYNIRWYKNGELQGVLNDKIIVEGGNTTKGEFWKFTIQVFDGDDWSIIYTSTTVSILNTAPEVSGVVTITATSFTRGNDLTVDYTYFDADNDQQIGTEIRWYKNNVQQPYDDEMIIPGSSVFKGDEWNVTVLVNDGSLQGTLAISITYTISNTVPEVTSGTIIYTGDLTTESTLGTSYNTTDADGDSIADFQVIWWVDNLTGTYERILALENQTIVTPASTLKDQLWKFDVIVFDGDGWSGYYNASSVTILNTPPMITNITLSGGSTTDEDITVTYAFIDPDGDSDAGTAILWQVFRGITPITGLPLGSTLASSNIQAGDLVYCLITPNDGDDADSLVITSVGSPDIIKGIIIVGNMAPVLTNDPVIIGPNGSTDFYGSENLYINYSAVNFGYDRDGDDAPGDIYDIELDTVNGFSLVTGAKYEWYKNGLLMSALKDPFVYSQYLSRGDHWKVRVSISDRYGALSPWYESPVITINNSLPVIQGITWSTTTPMTIDDLVIIDYHYHDFDNDPDGFTRIQWFINGSEILDNENNTLLSSDFFIKDDTIHVIITPHDGEGYGNPYNSSIGEKITVMNALPTVLDLSIENSSSLLTDSDLIANWTFYDVDGDNQDSYTIFWYRNGILQSNLNDSLIVGAGNTSKDETWFFTLEVFDGEDYSILYQSNFVFILNYQMSMNEVLIDVNGNLAATTALASDTFSVTVTLTDLDGDMVSDKLVYWYVNGEYRAEFDNDTFINAFTFVKGDVIHCVYRVHDGEEWSKSETSQLVTIINSLPEVSNIIFILEHGVNVVSPVNDSREFLIEDEALIIDYHFHDDDVLDSDESLVYWYCNGELQDQYTNSKFIPASITSPGDVWQVMIIPHDGDEGGYQVVSTTITIESRPIIHDHGIEIQPETDGFYHFWTKISDERNPIDRVIYDITVNGLDHFHYQEIITKTNRTVDTWVINDFQLLKAVRYLGYEDNYLFALVGTNVTVRVTVISKVAYSAVDYSIKSSLVFTFTIQNDAFTGDDDGDGLTNLQEHVFGSRSDITDTDLDGIDDYYEWLMGMNPVSDDSSLDEDHDGLPNLYEYQHGLLANVDDANEDKDGDGLTNIVEFRIGTDPLDEDTDHDSYPDKLEYDLGYSPLSDFSNPRIKSVISSLFIIVIALFYYPLILIIKQREIIRIIIAQIHNGLTRIKNGLKKVVTTTIVVLTREICYQSPLKVIYGLLSVVQFTKSKDKIRATIATFRPLFRELEDNLVDLSLVISLVTILLIALHEPLAVLPVTITISCMLLAVLCGNLLLEIGQRLKLCGKLLLEIGQRLKIRKIAAKFRPLFRELEDNLEDLPLVISVAIILMIALQQPLTVLPVTITISCVLLAVLCGRLLLEIRLRLKIRKITAKFPLELMELQEGSKKLLSRIDDIKVALREEFVPLYCRELSKIQDQHDEIQSSVQTIAREIDASLDASPEYKPRLYQLVTENESLAKHLHDELIQLRDEMILPLVSYIEQNATSYDDFLLLRNLFFLIQLQPSREQLQPLKPLLISILFSTSGNELLRSVKKLLGFTHESPAKKEKTKPMKLVLVK